MLTFIGVQPISDGYLAWRHDPAPKTHRKSSHEKVEKVIFYKRMIGDIQAKTGALTCAEMGIYDRFLDYYYSLEEPLSSDFDDCCRIARAMTKEERKAVEKVLAKFFKLTDRGYEQGRAEEMIAEARPKIEAARVNGRKGGRPKNANLRTPNEPTGLFSETETEPSGKTSQSQSQSQSIGVQEKNSVCGLPTHTLPDSFKAEIQKFRPDLNPDIVWGVFVQKTNSKDRTIAVWRSWIARERPPVKVAVNPLSDPDTRSSIEAEGVARGLGAWQEGKEQWASYKAKVRGDKLPGLTVAQLTQVAQRRTA